MKKQLRLALGKAAYDASHASHEPDFEQLGTSNQEIYMRSGEAAVCTFLAIVAAPIQQIIAVIEDVDNDE